MECRGAAPRGLKRTSLPVVVHVENVPPLLNKTRERLLAGFSFWDHGGPPPLFHIRSKMICLLWNAEGAGETTDGPVLLGPRGAAPISYSIKKEFAFDGMQRGRARLLACVFFWDHGGGGHPLSY